MSSCTFSLQFPKALPSLSPPKCKATPLRITSKHKSTHNSRLDKKLISINKNPINCFGLSKCSLAIQIGAVLATVEQPALAVTGMNNQEVSTWVLIQWSIIGFCYFIIMPPIILNWLRVRWYRRKLLEMYLQFMFVFIFYPGILLWAPFLNFRKFPRDPSLKYPWSRPEDPSKVKSKFRKYPFATPEDYD